MPATSLLYRAALAAGRAALPLVSFFDPKLRRGYRGRQEVLNRLGRWAATGRDPSRPLVWIHASSVGEGRQAETVVRRLRARHPDWQLAYTFFSPSAESLAASLPVDVADYLPWDLPRAVERALDALRPQSLVFTKLDLWPELATRAARRGAPVALIAATVRPGSRRLGWPARWLLRPGYRVLEAVAAIAQEDAERLHILGARANRIRVLGDPRFDSVRDRVLAVAPDDPLLRFGRGAPTMVAGSTWPGDEAVVLGAFARLHVHRPDARLILVPHEPSEQNLSHAERLAAAVGLPAPVRLSRASGPVPLLLVDQTGLLPTLYGAGTMAYVGGAYHRAGLHSVLEPAAWERPVAFGPRWQQSRDAGLLLQNGAAEALPELGTGESVETLQKLWDDWMRKPARLAAQGRRAGEVVRRGLGAADQTTAMVEDMMRDAGGTPAGRAGAGIQG